MPNSELAPLPPAAPLAPALDDEYAAAAAPVEPSSGLPKHIQHLWAVADANGLKDQPRNERLDNSNVVLVDHEMSRVASWKELSVDAAQCFAGAIDAGSLKWGKQSLALPLEAGEAA